MTSAVTSTVAEAQGDTVPVLLYPTGEMGPGWTEQVFAYGETEDTLGTAPGGDGLMFGPEYGVQAADGTWWFMDAAKMRFAQFADDGAYLSQAEFPTEILVQGLYFQYQLPQALDDGSIVASGFRGEAGSSLLRFAGGEFTGTDVDASVLWALTDGELLYGFSAADGAPHSLDPSTDTPVAVEWFLARDGSRFMVTLEGSDVTVDLPDGGVTKTLQLRYSEDPTVAAMAGIEVKTTEDGSIHILAYGVPETDEGLEIGAIVSIAPDGLVANSEPIVSPFSESDPGSPSHLGTTPGSDSVWYMVVGVDGVHVYTRAG
ncbi:MAG TPA: hypothetical protein VG872_12855 [Acidimicrobiia bacterium]|jgi:hypothetical protein|nr:hypothetical protein [Acidimicrobiia bacterium]